MQQKRRKLILYSALFAGIVALLFNHQRLLVWAQSVYPDPDSNIMPTVLKDHLNQEDIVFIRGEYVPVKANVLFLVDVGSAMLFTSRGKLPDWNAEYNRASGTTTQKRATANSITAAQMAESTFGSGGANNAAHVSRKPRRDGRDLDSSNNVRTNPDNYYNTSVLGYPPNDSRMYKMKLVLWRMLDEQKDLFEKFRFALAATYQEESPLNIYVADFYKAPNYDANATFPHGQGPPWATGASAYNTSQNVEWGIDVSLFEDTPTNRYPQMNWFAVNRAFLRVPFGEITSKDTRHISVFRTLINGVEDSRKTSPNPYGFQMNEPELLADGRTQLSTAIFPGYKTGGTVINTRNDFLTKNLIFFSQHNTTTTVSSPATGAQGFHSFGKGSGEAVGTVLDFFSPPVQNMGASKSAMNVHSAMASNFPIQNSCEPNWLIVFTAGDDSAVYSSPEAVRDLYTYTRDRGAVRIKDRSKPASQITQASNLEMISLDQGIRTMVIGFVDTTDPDPKIQSLVKTLKDMADYGWDGEKNGIGEAYFANDVPGLMSAMAKILSAIAADIPQRNIASSPALIALSGPDGQGFQPSFIPKSGDQWEGIFEKFHFNTSTRTITQVFSLGEDFRRYANANKSGRSLYAWNTTGTGMFKLNYPSSTTALSDLANVTDTFSDDSLFTGGVNAKAASAFMLRWLFGQDTDSASPNSSFTREAVLTDLGAGYTLMQPLSLDTAHTQPGHKDWVGTVNKNQPETVFIHTNDGMLHAIDNRGSADVKSDSNWGREHWAFVPPNALYGQRLLGLKFQKSQNTVINGEYVQKLTWINSKREAPRSNPAYTLDGNPYAYNLATDSNGSAWRSVLIGLTGRGGAGLYAVDITNPITAPQNANFFLWSIENNLSLFNTPRKPQHGLTNWGEVHTWTKNGHVKKTYTAKVRVDYDRLGLRMPPPLVGATLVGGKPRNVGILAAGIQYDLDLTKQGNFGSALYLFDPLDPAAKVIKTFDNTDNVTGITDTDSLAVGDFHTQNPKMGMMITPPASLTQRENTKYLEGFYTADSRGQIFEGRFKENGSFFNNEADWKLYRIATLRDPIKEQTGEDNFPMPYAFSVGRESNGSIWLANGTADVTARNIGEDLFRLSPRKGVIERKQVVNGRGQSHYLFAFKRSNNVLQLREATSDGREASAGDTEFLDAATSEDYMGLPTSSGWVIPLARSTDTHQREYLATSTLIYVTHNAVNLFASTFVPTVPKVIQSDDARCGYANQSTLVNGDARLYKLDLKNGRGLWPDTNNKYYEFKGIKVKGLSLATDANGKLRLYVSMTILDTKLLGSYLGKTGSMIVKGSPDYEKAGAYKISDTLMELDPQTTRGNAPENMKLDYWRELFPL